MKKTTIAFVFLFAFGLTSNAQDYDLNTYKYRFQKFKGFNTSVLITGESSNSGERYKLDSDTLRVVSTNDNREINYNFDGNYFEYVNTETLQQFKNASFQLTGGNSFNGAQGKTTVDTFTSHDKTNQLDFRLNYTNTMRYYKPNNHFKYLSLNGNIGGRRERYYEDPGRNQTNWSNLDQNIFANSSIVVGFGRGRLELVQDPVLAMFIVKDLQDKGELENLSNEQVESLAKGITYVRNQRYLDFRYQLIDIVGQLDSVFKANGAKPKNDLVYYSTLYDNWLYATEFQRYSGKRSTFSLSNQFGLSHFYNSDNNGVVVPYSYISNYYSWSPDLVFNYNYYTQKSLHWQNNFDFSISAGLSQTRIDTKFELLTPNTTPNPKSTNYNDWLNTDIQIGYAKLYQPNSRTFLNLSVRQFLSASDLWEEVRTSNPDNKRESRLSATTWLDAEYFRFVNARLSFRASAGGRFIIRNHRNAFDEAVTTKRIIDNSGYYDIQPNFSASLNYALF